jgi:hypothetical protein
MVPVKSEGISADVKLVNKNLSLLDLGIRIFNIDPTEPEGFDFGSQKNQSGFIFVFNLIIKPGFAIFRDGSNVFFSQNPFFPLRNGINHYGLLMSATTFTEVRRK